MPEIWIAAGAGVLVWLNILAWLVYGAWQELRERRKSQNKGENDGP